VEGAHVMPDFMHVDRWRKYRPDLFGKKCRVLVRSKMNSALVEFEDGTRHVVSRFALRKLPAEVPPEDPRRGGTISHPR
jgi:hypothetical protein